MTRFRTLRTRLTVLYAGLFALAMLAILATVYSAISDNVLRVVRGELAASGTVFDRIWAMRALQIQNGAGLLSRDFGFREAIATQDDATTTSALENLRLRLGIDIAFMIRTDGKIIDGGDRVGLDSQVLGALQQDDTVSGVLIIGGTPYEVVSTPVLAPLTMGSVVVASRIDAAQMRLLEGLSAIPLDASILIRDPVGDWRSPDRAGATPAGVSRFVDAQLRAGGTPGVLQTDKGPTIALAKSLRAIPGAAPAVLLLRYPIARALAPYQPLLLAIAALGLLGGGLLVLGSWALARSVTRPLSDLGEAASRLRRGEDARVEVPGDDEIARLAEGFNAMAAEISERERRILHLASHDPDSDLPNRYALERAIEALVAGGGPGLVVVGAIGVDRFTHVRSAIGHGPAGVLLGEVGRRMAGLRPGLGVARLSTGVLGVTFRCGGLEAAREVIEALHGVVEEPVQLGETTVDVSLTAGIAWPDHSGEPTGAMIERANIALDQALKSSQKIALFDRAAYGDPAENLSLMGEMRRAVTSGDLVLYYQPKLDLTLNRTTGVEALVRWPHPVRGLIGPGLFVPMAEETGHIRALTDWVLATAIADQRRMIQAGRALKVSVNISGTLLGDADFAEAALRMIASAAGAICFEITETAVIDNPEQGLAAIDRFAAAGVAVSIDDYGVGLSSLTYLKQFRADELKIDQSFIVGLADNARDWLLVRSTIDLAHGLNLEVTAEGVEGAESLAILRAMGCDHGQGYFLARPMPLAELLAFMDNESQTTDHQG